MWSTAADRAPPTPSASSSATSVGRIRVMENSAATKKKLPAIRTTIRAS